MNTSRSPFNLLTELWSHIDRRRRVQLALLGCLMALSALAELVSIGSVIPFIGALMYPERLYENPWLKDVFVAAGLSNAEELLFPMMALFALAAIASGSLRVCLVWAQTRLSFAIGADLGSNIYRRTLYQQYSVHVARNSSEVVSAILTKSSTLVYVVIMPILNLASAVLILICVLTLLLFVDPIALILSTSVLGLLYVVIYRFARKQLVLDGQIINREQSQVLRVLNEGLGGIRDVLIDRLQEAYVEAFRRADWRLRRSNANIAILGSTPRFVIEAAAMLLIGLTAYYLVNQPGGANQAIPTLGVLALGAQRLLPLLQLVYYSVTSLRSSGALVSDVLDLLRQWAPVSASHVSKSSPLVFHKQIELTDIEFKYQGNSSAVLQNVSLQIPRGARIGIIGTTGSGKSTLLDVIMGLLPPTKGAFTVDNQKIDKNTIVGWQMLIAHVPQNIYLADATIAENIAFGVSKKEIDLIRVKEAAKGANIDSAIESFQHGYETKVGERGVRLSGGERQRIGIARALYKKAELIIFDEATSALDSQTEAAVLSAITALPRHLTLIMVAHRLTTLESCDAIFKIENGTTIKLRSYRELSTDSSIYLNNKRI
jgi:ABC-type multidrug transport system fused ATPase/permease subunit